MALRRITKSDFDSMPPCDSLKSLWTARRELRIIKNDLVGDQGAVSVSINKSWQICARIDTVLHTLSHVIKHIQVQDQLAKQHGFFVESSDEEGSATISEPFSVSLPGQQSAHDILERLDRGEPPAAHPAPGTPPFGTAALDQ